MLWYEKYRPTELDDYVWTDDATKQMLIEWIENPLDKPHLILAGPTGTGKTTLAKIIRSMLNLGSEAMFIPASMQSGVEMVRSKIVNFCEAGGFGGMKLIIFDEADRLSQDAQEMMRNVIDRYQEDVRFIFTCNRLNKIIEPVQGRMWVVQVSALNEEEFIERLIDIAINEDVDLEQDGAEERLDRIMSEFYPNLRTAISALQRSFPNGVLADVEIKNQSSDWENNILGLFANFDMDSARRLVSGMRPDEYEDAYRFLYDNSEVFGDNQGEAIIVIAEQLFRHSQAGLPDITLAACLLKLGELNDG